MKHKTPAQLISEEVARHPHEGYSMTEMMEKYGKQQSLLFHEWMDKECWTESHSSPGMFYQFPMGKTFTRSQLYNKLLKSQK